MDKAFGSGDDGLVDDLGAVMFHDVGLGAKKGGGIVDAWGRCR